MWRLFFAFVLACGSQPARGPVSNRSYLPSAVSTSVHCYEGSQRSTTGEVWGLLLRRTVDEEHARITEDWIRTSSKTPPLTATLVIDVVGSRYTVHERGREFATGLLHGEPWRWTSWTTMLPIGDGSKTMLVTSTEVTATGLHSHSGVPEAAGSTEQDLTTIACGRYEEAAQRLAIKTSPP